MAYELMARMGGGGRRLAGRLAWSEMTFSRAVELLANLGIVVVVVLLGVALVTGRGPGAPTPRAAEQSQAGGKGAEISLPGVDWREGGRTLVLALSSGCRYCTESAPFYRRLRAEVGEDVRVVAVLPQPAGEAREYLGGLGVEVDAVVESPLDAIGVEATPTMLVVNQAGVVEASWVGQLPAHMEDAVLRSLR